MKKIFSLLFCLLCLSFLAKSQETSGDSTQTTTGDSISPPVVLYTEAEFQGFWTLTALDGNNSAVTLTAEEIDALTQDYLLDLPLINTTLDLSGTNFSLVHHGTAVTSGEFEVNGIDQYLILRTFSDGCEECAPKERYLFIRSISANELVLDMPDEDGTGEYAHLVFTK